MIGLTDSAPYLPQKSEPTPQKPVGAPWVIQLFSDCKELAFGFVGKIFEVLYRFHMEEHFPGAGWDGTLVKADLPPPGDLSAEFYYTRP